MYHETYIGWPAQELGCVVLGSGIVGSSLRSAASPALSLCPAFLLCEALFLCSPLMLHTRRRTRRREGDSKITSLLMMSSFYYNAIPGKNNQLHRTTPPTS